LIDIFDDGFDVLLAGVEAELLHDAA